MFLLAARKGGDDETILAAIDAPAERGGRKSLETVHRISRNTSLSAPLYAAALAAVERIRRRLGETAKRAGSRSRAAKRRKAGCRGPNRAPDRGFVDSALRIFYLFSMSFDSVSLAITVVLGLPVAVFIAAVLLQRAWRRRPFRRVFRALESAYGFARSRRSLDRRGAAAGRIAGDDFTVDVIDYDRRAFVAIQLRGKVLLPEIFCLNARKPDFPGCTVPPEGLHLAPDDLLGADRSAGRELFGTEARDTLRGLMDRSTSFSLQGGSLSVILPCDASAAEAVRAAVAQMTRLAALLRKSGPEEERTLRLLAVGARESRAAGEQGDFLRQLAARYPDNALTRETLLLLADGPRFGIGLQAAGIMGVDLLPFAAKRLAGYDVPNQIQAVRAIAERRTPAGADLLAAHYERTFDPAVRSEILLGLWHAGDARAGGLCLRVVDGGDPVVASSAVQVLAAAGGEDALAPLARLAGDEWKPPGLRLKAREALAAVRARLAAAAAGRLSLAGDVDAGGLSLAGGEQAGKKEQPPGD